MRENYLEDEVAKEIAETHEDDWERLENTLRDKDNASPIDVFLKVDGAEGESQDEKHKNEIEVITWSHRILQKSSVATGSGGGAGVSYHFPFLGVAIVSKATPKLFEMCCSGKPVGKMVITFRKAGGDQQEYRKITLSNVMISRHGIFEQLDPVTGLQREGFALDYAKIEDEIGAQDSSTGSVGGKVKWGWDREARAKV